MAEDGVDGLAEVAAAEQVLEVDGQRREVGVHQQRRHLAARENQNHRRPTLSKTR